MNVPTETRQLLDLDGHDVRCAAMLRWHLTALTKLVRHMALPVYARRNMWPQEFEFKSAPTHTKMVSAVSTKKYADRLAVTFGHSMQLQFLCK